MKERRLSVSVVLVSIFLMSLAGCQTAQPVALNTGETGMQPAEASGPSQESSASPAIGEETLGAIAALEGTLEATYAQVNPSVVNIRVVIKNEASSLLSEIPSFPFFNQPAPQEPQEYYSQGMGSGFVWDQQGHIVTNNHVVDGADKIEVTFYDGTVREATLIGSDPDSDLAVVQVDDMPAQSLHPVELTDSTQVKVGELAIAIGNPFGLQGTMTVGIVSAIGRSLPVESDLAQGSSYTIPDIIQTDAPINPGNSGGVLVDETGRVMGVTSAIASPVRASAGIGFVIPSAIVQKVVPTLITKGHYEHPWLGISGTSLTPDMAAAMGLDKDQQGALVVEVVAGSPADKAGLQGSGRTLELDGRSLRVGGDVITHIDGHVIRSFDDLVAVLTAQTEVGQQVKLSILREGHERNVTLTLAPRPTNTTEPTEVSKRTGAWLGIMGINVTADIAKAAGFAQDQTGVLIVEVVEGGPADKAGLHEGSKSVIINGQEILIGGDVIVGFNGEKIETIQELQSLLAQAETGTEARVEILRNGEQMQVNITLGV